MARIVYGPREMANFERAIRREAQAIGPAAAKSIQAVLTRAVHKEVLLTTPVLTGQARYNWFLTLNVPSTERYWFQGSIVIYGSRVTARENRPPGVTDVTGQPMTGEEKQRVSELLRELAGMPLGQRVWITNNLWYVVDLNEGTSTKAPQGITYVAIDRALSGVRRKKLSRGALFETYGIGDRPGRYTTSEREGPEGGDRDSVRIGMG